MRNPSTPSPVIDVRDTATPTEDPTPRAEQALPPMFHPSPLAAPALRAHQQTALEYAAETLGEMRLAADMIALPRRGRVSDADRTLAAQVSTEAGRLQRLLKALAAGALGLAVLAGIVTGPSAGHAEAATVAGKTWTSVPAAPAMEPPSPDPQVTAPATVAVSLSSARVIARVPVTTVNVTPGGFHCAALLTDAGILGRACGLLPTVTVPVILGRYTPIGRSSVLAVDDVAPWTTPPARIVLDVRRPSRFGVGTYLDMGRGDLWVRVPVTLYSAAQGRWVPQVQSPVQIQELTRRGWRTRATLTTNPPGLAVGLVHLGGGRHIIRAVRPAGATVWSTTGTNRLVVVTTEPLDVI